MRIFLVRHGQSEANADRGVSLRMPDHAVPLTALGRDQAAQAGRFLAETLGDGPEGRGRARIWNSPYLRTRQTADAIEAALSASGRYRLEADTDNPVGTLLDRRESPLIVEQQFGLFDGYEDDERALHFPREQAVYVKNCQFEGKYWARMPQGESRFDVSIRVHQFFGTILRDAESKGIQELAIVSHGVTIRAFVMMWLHRSPEWFEAEQNPGNCAIRLIEGGRGSYRDRGYVFLAAEAPAATEAALG